MRVAATLVLLASFGAAEVSGQGMMARLAVRTGEVHLGEPFEVWVTVISNVRPGRPLLEDVEGFEIEFAGRRDRRLARETIFTYVFRPIGAGKLEIPPILVEGGGFATRTPRAMIEVHRGRNAGDERLRFDLPAGPVYVGQQIETALVLECDGHANDVAFNLPFLGDGAIRAILPTAGARQPMPDGWMLVRVNRKLARGKIARGSSDMRLEVPVVLIPQRARRIELASATVRGSTPHRRLFATADAMTLDVRPLPTAGAPTDFSGLVGPYSLTAAATPTEIQLGQPIQLDLTLSGQLHLEGARIGDPTAALSQAFRVHDVGDPLPASDYRVFRYLLQPREAGPRVIPAIGYSYFDPEENRYISASTREIPIVVKQSRQVTATDAEGSRAVARIENVEEGIAHNYEGAEALVDQEPDLRLAALAAIALALLPIVGFVLIWRRAAV